MLVRDGRGAKPIVFIFIDLRQVLDLDPDRSPFTSPFSHNLNIYSVVPRSGDHVLGPHSI